MKNSLSAFVFLLPLCVQPAAADDFKIIPAASLKQEYNDNVFFSQDDAEEDLITTASVGLVVSERTERLAASLSTRLDGLAYSDNDALNDIEEFYRGNVQYQLNPFWRLSAGAEYNVDSRPDRDVDVTGYTFSHDVRRKARYTAAADYQYDEKTGLLASYSYQDEQFETEDSDEVSAHTVVVGMSRSLQFIKPTVLRLFANYAHYSFYTSRVDNYRITAGLSRDVSEKLNYMFDIGPRYTDREDKVADDSNDDTGVGGSFTLTYRQELTTADMRFSHEVSGSGGRNGITKRTGLAFSMKHLLGERSYLKMRLDSYLNKADGDDTFSTAGDVDDLTTSFSPSIHYAFTNEFSCEAQYRYSVINDRDDDTERHRNMVFVKLTYKYPVVE